MSGLDLFLFCRSVIIEDTKTHRKIDYLIYAIKIKDANKIHGIF